MAGDLQIDGQEKLARLPIHFEVPENHLNAEDYLIAVSSFKTTLEEINRRIFEGKLEIDFLVLPAEDGNFKGVTGIVVKGFKQAGKLVLFVGSLAAIIEFSETDSFKGFVKGLTGYEVKHYEASKDLGALLHDMLVGFYSTETEKLERLIPSEVNLDKAIKAKTEFYTMCIQNSTIRGIGFNDSENFPISRDRFPHHLSKDRVRPVESDFIIHEAIIVSPVDVDKDTKWEFQDTTTKAPIKAYMRDEAFKKGFLSGQYPLKESQDDDTVQILVEYKKQEKNGEIENKETCVETVYSFNGTEIVPLPNGKQNGIKFKQPEVRPMDKFWEQPND